jgi:hypothetical protein
MQPNPNAATFTKNYALRGDIGLARLQGFYRLTSIEPKEVGENSGRIHGEFMEGS